MASPYAYNPQQSGFGQGLQSAASLARLQQYQQQNQREEEQQQALAGYNQALSEKFQSGGDIGELYQTHPAFAPQIAEMQQLQGELKNTNAKQFSGAVYRALQRGDIEGARANLMDPEAQSIISGIGDKSLTPETALQMLETDREGLQGLAEGIYYTAGGKRDDLLGAAAKAGTFKNVDTGTGIDLIDTRTGETVRTIPKTKEKRFVQTIKTQEGTKKIFSDGSEEPISDTETVKTPDMKAPMSFNNANEIISDSGEGQRKDAGFALRINDSLQTMDHLIDKDNPNRIDPTRSALISKAMGDGTIANYNLSPDEQTFVINARDSLMAILRRESGAAIGVDEIKNATKTYLPQPGDSDKAIKAKRRLLQNQFDSIRAGSGRVYDALRVTLGKGEGPDRKWLDEISQAGQEVTVNPTELSDDELTKALNL